MPRFWQKLLGPIQVLRASRRFGTAVRFEKAGRDEEALVSATQAMQFLRRPGVDRRGAAPLSLVLSIAMLLDKLGTKGGQPQLARPAMADALSTWEDAVAVCPGLKDVTDMSTYVDWFRHRLSNTE